MGSKLKKNKPLINVKGRISNIGLVSVVLAVIMITGITFAFLYFQGGEKKNLDVGSVELNTSINYVADLSNMVSGDTIITSSSFSKTNEAVSCYVRVKLEFGSDSLSLTRQQKNYILALNSNDYTSSISTGVDGVSWLSYGDNHYYLVDSNSDLLVVNNTTVYSFASELKLPMLIDILAEGLEIDTDLEDLYLDVKFQAIQSQHLPSIEFNDVKELFDIVFKTKPQEEFLVRFASVNGEVFPPQVVRRGGKVVPPTKDGYFIQMYLDEELTQMFGTNNIVNKSYTLYYEWLEKENPTAEGLIFKDNAVVGYYGDEQRVIIPESYTLGERKLVNKTFNDSSLAIAEWFAITNLVNNSEYDVFPVTLTLNGQSESFNNATEFNAFEDFIMIIFLPPPFDISYYVYDYEVGGDTKVTEIGDSAFLETANYVDVMMKLYPDSLPIATTKRNTITSISIPDTIESIASGAFAFTRLNQLVIPESVTSIGEGALYSASIGSLTLPAGVEVENNLFIKDGEPEVPYTILELYNQTDIEINAVNEITSLNQSQIYTYKQDGTTFYFENSEDGQVLIGTTSNAEFIVLPENGVQLTHLYNNSRITLNDYVVGDGALSGNHHIKKLTIGNNVTQINERAFEYCSNLELMLVDNNSLVVEQGVLDGDFRLNVLTSNNDISSAFNSRAALPDSVYLNKNTGYDAVEFADSTSGLYATGIDASENKWVRLESDTGYSYYMVDKVEIDLDSVTLLEGFTFSGTTLVEYTGSVTDVVVPESYSIIRNFTKATIAEFDQNAEYGLIVLDTGDAILPYISSEMFMYFIYYSMELGVTEEEVMSWVIYYSSDIYIEGNQYNVIRIHEDAFRSNTSITSVALPNTVRSIDEYAFADCTNLTTINIPEGKTTLEEEVFNGCRNLVSVQLPSTLQIIGDFAFYNCEKLALTSLPSGLINIGWAAFSGCTSLAITNLPTNVTLGFDVFLGCVNMQLQPSIGTNYYVEGNCIIDINTKSVLYGTNTSIVPDGVLSIADDAFKGATSLALTSLPDSIKSIGWNAFSGCTSLALTSLPNSLETISYAAFNNCTSLALTSLPSSLKTIGNSAFYNCTSLALTSISSNVSIGSNAFKGCTSLQNNGYVCYLEIDDSNTYNVIIPVSNTVTTVVWPENVVRIEDYAFSGCTQLNVPELPSTLISIGEYAFDGCTSLALTSLPDGVNKIEQYAFRGCTSLALTSLPDDITRIETYTFYGCTSLALTSLPSGLTFAGRYAFCNCTNLALTSLPNSLTSIDEGAFRGCSNITLTSLPEGLSIINPSVFYGCTSLVLTSLPQNVTSIGNFAFRDCTNLVLETLPSGLVSIGEYAFSGCTSLALTELPNSLNSINLYAFYNCTSLALTSLPSGLINIADYAFVNCTNLALTSIPTGIIIGYNAFSGCTFMLNNGYVYYLEIGNTGTYSVIQPISSDITTIILPDNTVHIEDNAFRGISNLSITLPNTLQTIGDNAFSNCYNLTLTSLPSSLISIGASAFSNCSSLALTSLPSGITAINNSTFYECYNLALTSLPSGLISIGDDAFYCCSKLALTSLPSGLISIGDYAFRGCSNLALTSLPNNIERVGDMAFFGLDKIKIPYLPSSLTSIGGSVFTYCEYMLDNGYLMDNGYVLYMEIENTGKHFVLDYSSQQITTIVWPDNVIGIADKAFDTAYDLVDVKLPSTLKYIGERAFGHCYDLSLIKLHSGIISIGKEVFYYFDKSDYILCENNNIANLVNPKETISGNLGIYVLQASGYNGLTETEVVINDNTTIYTAIDADGYKWVRTSNNQYYKSIVVEEQE